MFPMPTGMTGAGSSSTASPALEQLQRLMPTLTPEEFAGAKLANTKLALAITPYFFNLIDPADENCPIRRQVIPRSQKPTPRRGK